MRFSMIAAMTLSVLAASNASATTFTFDSDPFAGSTALTTPGRQVVGGEPSISFDTATDRFVFDRGFFAVGDTVSFANDVVSNLATSGLNVIVLETFDNDGNSGTPFGAGTATNLLAGRITTDGAGFFVYFNQGLDVPRLVYSTNLNDETADLKILARMTNLAGSTGALAGFTAANFDIAAAAVPEPAVWAMMLAGFGVVGGAMRRTRRQMHAAYGQAR